MISGIIGGVHSCPSFIRPNTLLIHGVSVHRHTESDLSISFSFFSALFHAVSYILFCVRTNNNISDIFLVWPKILMEKTTL